MSDYERYGDYDDRDDDPAPQSKSIFVRLIKYAFICLLIGICAIIVFRLILSGYYPREMKKFYMTDALLSYEAAGMELDPDKLDLKTPYDNPDFLNFFADNAWIEENAGALQCSVRFTETTLETLAAKLSLSSVPVADAALFDFTLVDNRGVRYHATYTTFASYLRYHAVKLCFDAVDFVGDTSSEETDVDWLRLEIYYIGSLDYQEKPYATIPIYGSFEIASGPSNS